MTSRGDRWAIRLAWGVGVLCLVVLLASVMFLALDWKAIDSVITAGVPFYLSTPITGILGVLIATRRPRNPIGWLLLAIALAGAIDLATGFIAIDGLLSGASPRGWVAWPAWIYGVTGTNGVSTILLIFLVLFFPTGRLLPGPRWRASVWVAFVIAAQALVASMIAVSPSQLSPRLPSVPNPLAVPSLDGFTNSSGTVQTVLFLLVAVFVLLALVVRFRRSHGIERSQLRWFVYVAGASLGLVLVTSLPLLSSTFVAYGLGSLGFIVGLYVLIPASIGIAVMKYGLYDIDVFISRTIVYGSLAVFITAVYVGIAVGMGTLIGSGGKPNLPLSIVATAIVAIGFQPVRERVQRVANRLVYGKRATPYEVLSQFSERVAESYASDQVLPRMARVLADGTAAELAEVWLRSGAELRRAAAFPLDALTPTVVDLNGAAELSIPNADRSVVVRHHGEVLGALTVTKRRGEGLTPIEIRLMDDLAHQAGLVLKNVGLTADLQARLIDLRASRQRLVAAQDDERRKLERNLHDGAQQYLVAIKVKLAVVEMLLTKDPQNATATLQQLKGDADEALETLRDLARGIYPPLLADKGLVIALQAQARKATLPVTVEGDGIGRYPQDIEAALYFCILEALQNIQKYARATRAMVRLREEGAQLCVEVNDDGCGFDIGATIRGNGLTNIEDRLDALGGELAIESTRGEGTTLRARVPVLHPMLAAS